MVFFQQFAKTFHLGLYFMASYQILNHSQEMSQLISSKFLLIYFRCECWSSLGQQEGQTILYYIGVLNMICVFLSFTGKRSLILFNVLFAAYLIYLKIDVVYSSVDTCKFQLYKVRSSVDGYLLNLSCLGASLIFIGQPRSQKSLTKTIYKKDDSGNKKKNNVKSKSKRE